jgi:hypothetical protein
MARLERPPYLYRRQAQADRLSRLLWAIASPRLEYR